jgi:ADP-heptose:LPS heptosyltransferase
MNQQNPSPSLSYRLLVIRFSSFGDIVQGCSIPIAFHQHCSKLWINSETHWLVRADFANLLKDHPNVQKTIVYSREIGLLGLVRLAWTLAREGNYTHVYDAHNNLRSSIVRMIFRIASVLRPLHAPKILVRPKHRVRRWLFFRFRLPVLPQPFRGAESFLWPLKKWGLDTTLPDGPHFFASSPIKAEILETITHLPRPLIALAPSAAWPTKRWPIEHWSSLIDRYQEAGFVLLGGPDDHFIQDIASRAPNRCLNLAGKIGLDATASVVKLVDLVIANDTGVLHLADQMERPTIALIGPTAFGYPSHQTSQTMEVSLPCKPCSKDGRDRCRNSVYQKCMVDILPENVLKKAREVLT